MLLGEHNKPCNQAVRVFLNGLFDYAGLFPPASLSLEDAITKYAQYRLQPDSWMIGPFVCHVSSLSDLDAFGDLFAVSPPFRFSILTRTTEDSSSMRRRLQKDLAEMKRFIERHSGRVSTEMIEMWVPRDAREGPRDAEAMLSELRSLQSESPVILDSIFLEVSRDENFAFHLENVALAIESSGESAQRFGLKLRCGGMDAHAFPTPEHIAEFLKIATGHHVRFKATAGLHHAVRHLDENTGFMTHGFLNVFFAAALDAVHDVDTNTLVRILNEMDADAFVFSDDEIRWRDMAVSTNALEQIRERLAVSIGSCSFDEPRKDLVSLEWLTPESVVTHENTPDNRLN